MQSHADFLEEARIAVRDAAALDPRLVPSSFDPADLSLQAIPLSREYEWGSLARALKYRRAKIALLRLPLFWQVVSLMHAACQKAGCSLFVNEKDNMPLGEAAVRVGEANMVVTNAKDAFAFSLFLSEKNMRMPNWFIIHEAGRSWELPATLEEDVVVQEVHLFPGVPLLTQCETLAHAKDPRFHAASGMLLEHSEESALVTSAPDSLVPLQKYRLDFALESDDVCACGKEILIKKK